MYNLTKMMNDLVERRRRDTNQRFQKASTFAPSGKKNYSGTCEKWITSQLLIGTWFSQSVFSYRLFIAVAKFSDKKERKSQKKSKTNLHSCLESLTEFDITHCRMSHSQKRTEGCAPLPHTHAYTPRIFGAGFFRQSRPFSWQNQRKICNSSIFFFFWNKFLYNWVGVCSTSVGKLSTWLSFEFFFFFAQEFLHKVSILDQFLPPSPRRQVSIRSWSCLTFQHLKNLFPE